MIYLVGTGTNSLKSNFIYAFPVKATKKEFIEKFCYDGADCIKVINIASGNMYQPEADCIKEEQVFTSLNSALAFADQELDEMRVNVNIKKFLDGEFSVENIEDIFYGSAKAAAKVEEYVAPTLKTLGSMKETIEESTKQLNVLTQEYNELRAIAMKEIEKLRKSIPLNDFKSVSVEWDEEDFLKITKLNQALATLK